ncbi:hypothetical protein FisN_18Hh031 [Fistulifera solaris]|uniref:Uncharacterized protein n=1 Tax=Fistulifera solaris TaxID=1519565 RepID=A0A1Z5JVT0_FISSO|nr:hypothetical protein FisN_18Hh031 [Fistulifera solaris]|eukprot:GAX17831.1 hypothetical protein FisN_18Hh031 [Fistulifera solaris]
MPPHADFTDNKPIKHKRRYCRSEGCTNIVKSQGLCQRHGAKPRMCKVEQCSKQAQGNFDGMCKSHFKALKRVIPVEAAATTTATRPTGRSSVYDTILPASMMWNPESGTPMPLVEHLACGFQDQPPAWHRNEERLARGLPPVHNIATQLEAWEKELVWTEILLLTGNPESSFRHLARGWGRDKGFHTVLAQSICERRGNVERKKKRKRDDDEEQENEDDEEEEPTEPIHIDVYDEAVYGDYHEALAADLFCFSTQQSPPHNMFSSTLDESTSSHLEPLTLHSTTTLNRENHPFKEEEEEV